MTKIWSYYGVTVCPADGAKWPALAGTRWYALTSTGTLRAATKAGMRELIRDRDGAIRYFFPELTQGRKS